MPARFQPEFDKVAVALSLGAILLLLYYGLLLPDLYQKFWVAFAMWVIGFFGSKFMGLVKTGKRFTLTGLIGIGAVAGIGLMMYVAFNYAFMVVQGAAVTAVDEKLLSASIGICEELFFGVFILGAMINWIGIPPHLAIMISSVGHAIYHVPNWGLNIPLLMLFTLMFMGSRILYVFILPKVSVILGIHGGWNLGVA